MSVPTILTAVHKYEVRHVAVRPVRERPHRIPRAVHLGRDRQRALVQPPGRDDAVHEAHRAPLLGVHFVLHVRAVWEVDVAEVAKGVVPGPR